MTPTTNPFLPFYIGCECRIRNGAFLEYKDSTLSIQLLYEYSRLQFVTDIIPILRPLESMTEEEEKHLNSLYKSGYEFPSIEEMGAIIKSFCEKRFDVWNLHSQGLCLYRNEKGELY